MRLLTEHWVNENNSSAISFLGGMSMGPFNILQKSTVIIIIIIIIIIISNASSTLTLLVGHQEEHPARKKIEWWGTGVVICLEYGANDLHMVQLMPLPPHHLLLQ